MDNVTRFIDTLGLITTELNDLQKHLSQLQVNLGQTSKNLTKGDIRDTEARINKLREVKLLMEKLQNFIHLGVSSPLPKLYGALETFHTILSEKENEIWIVRSTQEELSASRTVDQLTDAITEYLAEHEDDPKRPKDLFIDNPDNFVADFVVSYLDHPITDRMSDMVISLVTDWVNLKLS
ncbi:MAG: hypothetical protein IJU40_00175 [Desulfovibrionaceae bacterium]|nr:hypothetical protein [Desulfovibrionaceae bacterium]